MRISKFLWRIARTTAISALLIGMSGAFISCPAQNLPERDRAGVIAAGSSGVSTRGLTQIEAVAHAIAATQPSRSDALAQQFLEARLKIWQQRLHLDDWKISISMISRENLKPNTLGHLHSDKDTGTASIYVMNVSSYKLPVEAMLEDMEVTLVHELVHLELSPLPLDEASRGAEEYTVNQLTEALLKLDRQNTQTPPHNPQP